jgi:hypothetical protein
MKIGDRMVWYGRYALKDLTAQEFMDEKAGNSAFTLST